MQAVAVNPRKELIAAALRAALFAVTYLAAAELGHALSFPGHFATFWPPSGVYVAFLVSTSRRRWPSLLLAALLANQVSDVLLHGKAMPVSIGFWLANTVEAVAGAMLLRRFGDSPFALDRLRHVIGLVAWCAIVSTALGALVGSAVVTVAFHQNYWSAWLVWWLSGVIGVIAFAPVVLTLLASLPGCVRHLRPLGAIEGLVLWGGVAFNAEYVFGLQSHPLVWTILPFMLWAALRFGTAGVSLTVLIATLIMVHNTAAGRGPFAAGWSNVEQMFLLRSFIAVTAVSFLTVSVVLQQQREAAGRVVQAEERWMELFDHMSEHVLCLDMEGRFLQVNRACREALGYTAAEMLLLDASRVVHPEDLGIHLAVMKRQLAGEQLTLVSLRVVTRMGVIMEVEGSTEFHFIDGQPQYSLSIFRDVTARNQQQRQLDAYRRQLEEANARLELLAVTDGLTRLKNRRAFQERLQEEVQRARRQAKPLSLVLMDVDHFKSFNDAFGHPAGDGVLRGVAQLLQAAARATDLVARYGGEEFVILLPDTDEGGALIAAERFRKAVADGEWRERAITVSVGAATSLETLGDGSELVAAADAALYHSKKCGRNCVHHANKLPAAPPDGGELARSGMDSAGQRPKSMAVWSPASHRPAAGSTATVTGRFAART
jgi:diguanylate cyclase (GGDEF)-like protein/PAS domain S-box-containing protein